MYYFTNTNEFTNRNRFFLNRNTSVRIGKGVLPYKVRLHWKFQVNLTSTFDVSCVKKLGIWSVMPKSGSASLQLSSERERER